VVVADLPGPVRRPHRAIQSVSRAIYGAIWFCQNLRVCRIHIFLQRYEQWLTFNNSDHHHHFTIPLQWVVVVVPCSHDPVTRLSRMQRIHPSALSNCYPPFTSPDFSVLFREVVVSSTLSSTLCGSPLLK
jgi:hypothetical protein